jgi:hypothetical protein
MVKNRLVGSVDFIEAYPVVEAGVRAFSWFAIYCPSHLSANFGRMLDSRLEL